MATSDSTTVLKTCIKCGCRLPLCPEFFHRDKNSKDGHARYCRNCINKRKNSIARNAAPDGYKVCSKCKSLLPANETYFYKRAGGKFGLDAKCIACRKNHYKENKSIILEKQRKYYAENRIEIQQRRIPYYEKTKEKRREYIAKWYRNNLNTAKVNNHRRKAREKSLPSDFRLSDWEYAVEYFHGCCAVCGRQLNNLFGEHKPAADHWIPLTSEQCPGTVPSNIVPLCHGIDGCNNHKRSKNPIDWLNQTLGRKRAKQKLAEINVFLASTRKVT